MIYPQALNYLNSFVNYERLNSYPDKSFFKLRRVRRLLELLGNPQQDLRIIHIAGSKGKGSICVFVANILKAAGFKVGLYTSPHLIDIRERIRILQKPETRNQKPEKEIIPKRDFARLIETIKPYAEKLRETQFGRLSYFEILTALAFLYFKEKECGFTVLEAGIGGRLDATNAADSFVCAISPISYEHTQVLGTSLKKIAAEKAGIIKGIRQITTRQAGAPQPNVVCRFIGGRQIVVTAPQRPTVLKIIKSRAKKVRAHLVEAGKDIQFNERPCRSYRQCFNVRGVFAEYPDLKIRLLGRHQIVNATVAVGCVESLRYFGIDIALKALREGLERTRWPGRLQLICRKPQIVLDAAHNRASARALKEALDKFFKFRNLVLVLGAARDKDIRGILRELAPSARRIILTRAQNPRALAPEIIKTFIKTNAQPVLLTGNSAQALKIARESATEKDLILVTGSLCLLGEVLKSQRK